MTISSPTRFITHNGNDAATVFTFPFKVFATSELVVKLQNDLTGVQTLQVLGTDYTAVLSAAPNSNPGGSITFILTAPATGNTVIITSDIALEQPTNLSNQGGFYPDVINNSLDRATIQIQQVANLSTRALVIPITDTGINTELPNATERALKYLIFDGNGNPDLATFSGGSISNSTLNLLSNVPSTSTSTGTLVVGPAGANVAGVGIGGRTFIGGTNAATATNTSGALNVAGGGYFASTCFINGMVVGNALNTGGTFPANTTAIGVDANLTCSNNTVRATVVGDSAGKTTTSSGGIDMTAIGYRVLQGNTREQCTAVGASAGYAGVANSSLGLTAVGYNAGTQASGTTNNGITAVGAAAASGLTGITTGLTAIGWNAAKDAAGAFNSTAVGYEALLNLSTTGCTAVGYQALKQTTAGANAKSFCTALGYQAGIGATAAGGTYLGYSAGFSSAAADLIAVGLNAGVGAVAGTSNSIFIGAASGGATGTISLGIGTSTLSGTVASSSTRNIAIGHQAMTSQGNVAVRNTIIGHNAAPNALMSDCVGVGEKTLGGLSGTHTAALVESVAVGVNAMGVVTTGARNIAIGYAAGGAVTTGSDNIYIGKQAGAQAASVALNNCIQIGGGVAAGNFPTVNGQTIIGSDSTVSTRIYGFQIQGATDPAISAATGTLTLTQPITRITTTGAVATITVPWTGTFAGQITLIPIVAFTTTIAGNIAVASTVTINRAITFTWSSATSKWYPSYT